MIEPDRIISNTQNLEEKKVDISVRPKTFADYIGQEVVKEQLSIFLNATKLRNDALDHCLVFGPPGLGKTTLANIIANELGVNLKSSSGPVLEKAADLASLLTNLQENDVLFIDEIHRLSPNIEEFLYPAMEDFHIDIIIGQGPAAQSIKLDLPPFTLVGATTRAGMLTSPLRDRFGIIQRLEYYTSQQLATIIKRSASILNIEITEIGALEIGSRARGTPRIANKLLRRARDYSQVKSNGIIDEKNAKAALSMLKVDDKGFDELDRNLLSAIINKFDGGPVGIETLAISLSEDKSTIEDVIEPFLIQQGYLVRTPRGRMATSLSFKLLGKTKIDKKIAKKIDNNSNVNIFED